MPAPFHSRLARPASAPAGGSSMTAVTPSSRMVARHESNRTGLVTWLTSPVRFDSCLATMRELGVTAVVELPPAGALAGLAKREWKGSDVEILALTAPKDLDRTRELLGGQA